MHRRTAEPLRPGTAPGPRATRELLTLALTLLLFSAVGVSLVALAFDATRERIAANERQALQAQLQQLLPASSYDNDPLKDVIELAQFDPARKQPLRVYRVRRGNEPVAALFGPVIAGGYAGPIQLLVAVDARGALNGVRVLAHRETPGLGDRIELARSDWLRGFEGRSLADPLPERWRVKRDGGDFDQFTGATVTPRAVVLAVRQTLDYFATHRDRLFSATG